MNGECTYVRANFPFKNYYSVYNIYTDTTHIRFFYASMSINLSAYCVMKMENCVFDKQIAEYSNCVFNRFLLISAKQYTEQWIYRQKQFNFIDQTFIILFSIVMTNTHVSIYECNDFSNFAFHY